MCFCLRKEILLEFQTTNSLSIWKTPVGVLILRLEPSSHFVWSYQTIAHEGPMERTIFTYNEWLIFLAKFQENLPVPWIQRIRLETSRNYNSNWKVDGTGVLHIALGPQNHEKWRFYTPKYGLYLLKMKVLGSHGGWYGSSTHLYIFLEVSNLDLGCCFLVRTPGSFLKMIPETKRKRIHGSGISTYML